MVQVKLKKISERNAFEQFLFNNVEQVCGAEVLDAGEVALQIGVSLDKVREWSRTSHYSTYIRGTVKTKPMILVENDALRQASEVLATQSAEEQKAAKAAAPAASYIKNVISGDVSAALILLQSAMSVRGIPDSLQVLLAKACAAVELLNAEVAKEK